MKRQWQDSKRISALLAALGLTLVHPCLAGENTTQMAERLYMKAAKEVEHRETLDNALADIDRAIALKPKDARYYTMKARILEEMEDDEQAIGVIEKARQLTPCDGWVWFTRATVLTHLGRKDEALKSADRAIELSPNIPHFYQAKTRVLISQNRWNEALAPCNQAIKLWPANDAIRSDRVKILIQVGKFDEAIQDATTCLSHLPHERSRDLLLLRAKAYTGAKQFKKAIDDYKSIVAVVSNDRVAHSELAKLYEVINDKESARKEKQFLRKFDEEFVPF